MQFPDPDQRKIRDQIARESVAMFLLAITQLQKT